VARPWALPWRTAAPAGAGWERPPTRGLASRAAPACRRPGLNTRRPSGPRETCRHNKIRDLCSAARASPATHFEFRISYCGFLRSVVLFLASTLLTIERHVRPTPKAPSVGHGIGIANAADNAVTLRASRKQHAVSTD